jgi:hypothetical protein
VSLPILWTPAGLVAKIGALASQVVAWAILLLVVGGIVWWKWETFLEHVRAPVVAELKKATDANASLDVALKRVEEHQAATDLALAEQQARGNLLVRRLTTLEQGRQELKATSPAAKKLLETPIPPELLR